MGDIFDSPVHEVKVNAVQFAKVKGFVVIPDRIVGFAAIITITDLVTRGDFAPRFLDTFLFEGRISDFKLE